MVGCNEDNWRTTSSIWFTNARKTGEYGAAFTGSRVIAANRTTPQSGMNVAGLVFSRLQSYHPPQPNPFTNKKKVPNEAGYLTDILHNCATIDDVKKYIHQYDHSIFIDDVFIYVDSTGRYLVVEPYTIIEGEEAHYVLSNFCPSITDKPKARKLERYRNGEDYLKRNAVNPSLKFCTALSDTMHVCRSRNGDGTLLTSIWDTRQLKVNLYFYHNFDTTFQFNIVEELKNGDHQISIPELFPQNPEFVRLATYKTPFNTPGIRIAMVPTAGVLVLLAIVFVFMRLRKRLSNMMVAVAGINILLAFYLFVLATNIYIYYFDAPYNQPDSGFISASSYTPFILLLALVPILPFSFKMWKSPKAGGCLKGLLVVNHIIYGTLIFSFGYWGLFGL